MEHQSLYYELVAACWLQGYPGTRKIMNREPNESESLPFAGVQSMQKLCSVSPRVLRYCPDGTKMYDAH